MIYRKIKELKKLPNNPRQIKDSDFDKLCTSIQDNPDYFCARPLILSDRTGELIIIAGNQRYEAAKHLKIKEVPTYLLKDLTEEREKEIIVRDNIANGAWDYDILSSEDWGTEQQLTDWGLDLPVDWGVEELEAEEDDFDIPDTIETSIILGDLIEIGEHRLLCGNSTDSDSVAKLMGGEKADMVFTDPPYDLKENNYDTNILLFTENAHVFIMHDDKGIIDYLRKSTLEFKQFFVANFGFASPRGNDPYLSHILISHERNGKAIPHKNMHDGIRSIMPLEYRFRLKDDKTEHKHQKPIKFIETFISHYSNEKNIVFDLFLGSGSTMVAAHQLKRKCYGMELDFKYVEVIIQRMLKLDNTLTIKVNGVDETKKYRN